MSESDPPKPTRRRKIAAESADASASGTTLPAKPVKQRPAPATRSTSAGERDAASPAAPPRPAAPRRARAASGTVAQTSTQSLAPAVPREPPAPRQAPAPVRRTPLAETASARRREAAVGAPTRRDEHVPATHATRETAPPPVESFERSPVPPGAATQRTSEASAAESLPSFLREKTPAPAPKPRSDPRPADSSPRSQRFIHWLIGYLPPQHQARALNYLVLMRMDRPVGALLLLWPTWWALWFASNDFPSPGLLVIFTLGVFVMRSAGCVINDYADHEWLDAHVERTRGRPMAAGRVTRREALILFGALLALAFVLVLFTNRLAIELSFVGAALAAIYPFTKRVTHLAQVVLGAAFGWSIPMAFAAVTNTLPPLCWLLFLANVLFSTIYDTEYAMVDRDDDLRVGAKSTAILFGDADRAIIGVLMATFLFAMLLAGTRVALHWPYYLGLAIATGLFGWQQWLIRDRSRAHCFAAFRNNNWVGLALWLGLLLALAIR